MAPATKRKEEAEANAGERRKRRRTKDPTTAQGEARDGQPEAGPSVQWSSRPLTRGAAARKDFAGKVTPIKGGTPSIVATEPTPAVKAPAVSRSVGQAAEAAAAGSGLEPLGRDVRSKVGSSKANKAPSERSIGSQTKHALQSAYNRHCPITLLTDLISQKSHIRRIARFTESYRQMDLIDRLKLVPVDHQNMEYREELINLLPLDHSIHTMFDKDYLSIFPSLPYLEELLRSEIEYSKYRQDLVDGGFPDPGREYYQLLGNGRPGGAIPVQVLLSPTSEMVPLAILRMSKDGQTGIVLTATQLPDALPTIWLYANVALFVYARLQGLIAVALRLQNRHSGSAAATTAQVLVDTATALKAEWEREPTPLSDKDKVASSTSQGKNAPPPKPLGPRWPAQLEQPSHYFTWVLPSSRRDLFDQHVVHPSPVQATPMPVLSPPDLEQQQADAQDNTERRVLRSGKQAPLALTEQALSNVEDGVRTMAGWRRESALHHHQLG